MGGLWYESVWHNGKLERNRIEKSIDEKSDDIKELHSKYLLNSNNFSVRAQKFLPISKVDFQYFIDIKIIFSGVSSFQINF